MFLGDILESACPSVCLSVDKMLVSASTGWRIKSHLVTALVFSEICEVDENRIKICHPLPIISGITMIEKTLEHIVGKRQNAGNQSKMLCFRKLPYEL